MRIIPLASFAIFPFSGIARFIIFAIFAIGRNLSCSLNMLPLSSKIVIKLSKQHIL